MGATKLCDVAGKQLAFSSILLATALGVLACSSEEQKSPQDEYAGRYARAKCSVLGPCCAANGLSFDADNCVLGGAGYVQSGVDLAEQHGAVFDAAAAEACIAATIELTRSCTSTNDSGGTLAPCDRVWSGTKSPGSGCTTDLDCAPSAEGRGACYFTSAAGEPPSGVCVIKTRLASVGDVCGATTGSPPLTIADCSASDLQCDPVMTTCQPLVGLGGTCGGFTRCVHGAYCDSTNTCVPVLAAGTACLSDDECSSGLCLHGSCAENDLGSLAPCTGASG